MNPEIETLKRCKCGGKAKIVCEPGLVDYVKCSKCDNRTVSYFDGVEYATYDWNHGGFEGRNIRVWSVNDSRRR